MTHVKGQKIGGNPIENVQNLSDAEITHDIISDRIKFRKGAERWEIRPVEIKRNDAIFYRERGDIG